MATDNLSHMSGGEIFKSGSKGPTESLTVERAESAPATHGVVVGPAQRALEEVTT